MSLVYAFSDTFHAVGAVPMSGAGQGTKRLIGEIVTEGFPWLDIGCSGAPAVIFDRPAVDRPTAASVPGIGRDLASGREWMLGARPEHMAAQPGMAVAPRMVDACERLGADELAHGRWGAYDVAVRHARCGPRAASGTALAVARTAHRLHVVDPVTGRRANRAALIEAHRPWT